MLFVVVAVDVISVREERLKEMMGKHIWCNVFSLQQEVGTGEYQGKTASMIEGSRINMLLV